jgi:hypothetical protein
MDEGVKKSVAVQQILEQIARERDGKPKTVQPAQEQLEDQIEHEIDEMLEDLEQQDDSNDDAPGGPRHKT